MGGSSEVGSDKDMFNFFVSEEQRRDIYYYIDGQNFNHIVNVLRMKCGDKFLVSSDGISSLCVLEKIESETAVAKIIEENFQDTELPVKIYLFQGLPKSDKMELIIQKTVELGVFSVVPTEMKRCVVKIEPKKKKSKKERWQSISESAAKQSKRNIIPEIVDIKAFSEALEFAKNLDLILVPYESKNGMTDTKTALHSIKDGMSVGVFIGPEGGFEESEIEKLTEIDAKTISLGKRILRTETAAITAVSMLMLNSEINSGGDKE